jgi:glycosyltransferase involved in cell wall biosynthesis
VTALPAQGRKGLRLVYLITSSGIGGAEMQVCALARAFNRRGWDVGVVTMLPLGEPFAGLDDEGIWTATLGMRRRIPDPRALLRLRGLLRARGPHVLHGHMVHANLMARASQLLVRTPVIVSTMHNQNEGAQWRYTAYRLTNRLSALTTAVSTEAVEEAIHRRAAPKGGIVFVPNGIDAGRYDRDQAIRASTRRDLGLTDQFTWLAVGRLVEAKAYPDMLSAFRLVLGRHPAARLLIAGTGPLEQSIRASIADLGLGSAATLLGLRSDVPALMQAADGFVMSSAWEGLPMVLLEATASSLPVVATDVGGSRDVVVDGVSGHIVPLRRPDALARAMCEVMALAPGQREKMGAAGRDVISSRFDLQVVADTWERQYVRLLRARSARTAFPPVGGP